ncbi:murein L,D-transpeptidase catalytic domain family protein [Stakelama tenebrarum]|uniref:Murein L,D-transpeptidase catalytic domain family protein n=1 Tax=Stakelama tenebrarum TaxID=2711215 RepID=A0A6G6Y501_9SPHN|nr:murein L,D-transpeptidase catalytic domain family protein [Sphingosinithalassobacter tenebrarum]QIG79877.1 murein L,D-transpeptidase catalytic domain family protein [Sphingosinithalassobacter tenebrarum]
MSKRFDTVRTRRAMLRSALVMAGGAAVSACASRTAQLASAPMIPTPKPLPPAPMVPDLVVQRPTAPNGVRQDLFERALAALDRHSMRIPNHDKLAIVDFEEHSATRRLHVLTLGSGNVSSYFVSHGSGSDPDHTGWLQRFSNVPGSNATSEGAYLTAEYYVGKHDRSQRLDGLDDTNNNARDRAIVVHGAWYANADMIDKWGKLGRSQGCFAVGENLLDTVFEELGQGRMIYASKVV